MGNNWINFNKSDFSFKNLCDLPPGRRSYPLWLPARRASLQLGEAGGCVLCGELNCYVFLRSITTMVE
jgi:hypothetical protein